MTDSASDLITPEFRAECEAFDRRVDELRAEIESQPLYIRRDGPVHAWFGLTYAGWLTVPRVALQVMPLSWQQRFADLMEEADALVEVDMPHQVIVSGKDPSGRFVSIQGLSNYRHPVPGVVRVKEPE